MGGGAYQVGRRRQVVRQRAHREQQRIARSKGNDGSPSDATR
jgi:hypothetical protein